MTNIQKIIEDRVKEFEKEFKRDFGWNSQDMDGFAQVNNFFVLSLQKVHRSAYFQALEEVYDNIIFKCAILGSQRLGNTDEFIALDGIAKYITKLKQKVELKQPYETQIKKEKGKVGNY